MDARHLEKEDVKYDQNSERAAEGEGPGNAGGDEEDPLEPHANTEKNDENAPILNN